MIQTKNIDEDCDIKLSQKYAGSFKFEEYQHMLKFYQKGELYFDIFNFFKELE